MKYKFKSSDYLFRPTAMGLALAEAGAVPPDANLNVVRDSKREGVLRNRADKHNDMPSVHVPVIQHHTEAPKARKAA